MELRLHRGKEGQEAHNTTSSTIDSISIFRALRLEVVVAADSRRKALCCLSSKVTTESSTWVTVKPWTRSRNP